MDYNTIPIDLCNYIMTLNMGGSLYVTLYF